MKRRELQALCKRHGLSAGGSNVDLVARLAATLSGGAAEEKPVGVVVGKGCLKRSGGGNGGSGEAKTVGEAVDKKRKRKQMTREIAEEITVSVQVNDYTVMKETHIGKKPENKRQPCRPSTQYQQFASFAGEEDEQMVPAPNMGPKLRRSKNNNMSRALTDAKGLKTAQPLMHNAAKTSMKDVVREYENAGLTKMNEGRGRDKIAKSVGKDSLSESSGEALPTEMQLEVIEPLRRSRRKSVVFTLPDGGTKGMHVSVRGDDLEKQPTEKGPVRRSTRKSVVSAMFEKESNVLTAEMVPEAHIKRSKHKSFLPNMLNDENMNHYEMVRNEELKNSKGKDVGKKLAIEEPARRSTRKSVVLEMLDRGTKGLTAEMNPEVHVRGSTRKSVIPNLLSDENMYHCEMVRNVELKNSKGEDAGKNLATKEPSRRSTRKSDVALLEKGTKGLPAEMNPEVHVRRSTRKSAVPNMPNNENKYHDESVKSVVVVAEVKQLEAKKPVRSNEEPNADADDMVVRESTQDEDEGGHEYRKDSSMSTPEVNPDNATVEVARRGQWLNSEVYGSDSGSSGNETDNDSFKSPEFKLNHLPTVNDEAGKQSDEGGVTEVASQQFHDTTVTVAENDFSCQNDIHDVRTCINPLEHHQPCSDKINSDDLSFLSGRSELEPVNVAPIDCSAGDNEEQYSVSPVTEETRANRENSNESTKKSLSDTVLCGIHTHTCPAPGQLVDILAKETGKAFGSDVNPHQCSNGYKEADKCPEVHSDAAAEKSNKGDDLCKNLSTVKGENPLASNLHVEGAAEDKSMLPIPINAEWVSSDGRHSSFGLKSLFAEEGNQQRYLIDDENIAVKVDSGNKSSDGRHSSYGLKSLFAEEEEGNQRRYLIDDENIAVKIDSEDKSIGCKTSTFYTRADCNLEDAAAQLIGEGVADDKIMLSPFNDFGACSLNGRNPLFGQRSLYAQEGGGSNVTNAASVAAEADRRKDLDNVIVGLHMESDGIHIEMDVGLVAVNPENKLALEPVQQGDAEEGIFVKPLLGSAIPDCKHQHALANEAVMHSVKNKRGSSTSLQSTSSPQSMSLQESMEETLGYGSLASAGVHSANRVDESNDCHTECSDGQTLVPEPVADHGTHVDSILIIKNGESNENEESPKASREEQVECGQLGLFKAANCMEVTNCQEVGYEGEEDCRHANSTDINTPCEKSDDNGSSTDAEGNSDALLSSSVIVPNGNDEVHLSSNISQQESTDCLDEPTLFFNVGVHQGPNEKCNKHKEDQVSSGVSTSDIFEPATANGLESGLTSLPANETSNLQDDQLNSEMESTQVVQSGISCAKNSTNILEFGFTVNVDKGTPSDHSLPKDCPMDHFQQHDIPVEKSLEASAMCLENSVLRTGGIATPDCKLQGALSEYSLKNDAETPNPEHSPFGLRSLFSEENMDLSRPHDIVAFPCAENKVDGSNVSHVKCRVEKTASAEPGLCEGSHDNLVNAKEISSCISSCQQVNEQEEFLEASHKKCWVASVHLDSADDVNQIEREIISSEVVCEKEEKMEVMSSNIDSPVRDSHASELATCASPVSITQICDSRSSPICEVHPISNTSQLESPDVFHQDHEVLCSEHNDQFLPGIRSSGFSEAVSIKFPENETMLLEAAETSELLDEKLNPQPECDELEGCNLSCVKDTEDSSDTEFVEYSIFHFPADGQIDSCQEMELPNDQSATKAREESPFFEGESVVGTCGKSEQRCQVEISTELLRSSTEILHQDRKEENNGHKEDQVTPCIPTIDISGTASTKGSEGGITLLPDAKLSVFTDVQLNSKLENIEEHNLTYNKDAGNIFIKRSADHSYHEQELLSDLSAPKSLEEPIVSLDGSICMDSCNMQAIPEDMPGPKSPEDYQDGSVSGSVGDMFEPSPTERTEQETTLLSPSETSVFKVEHLNNPNLVSIGEHSHSCDEDMSDMFCTERVESNNQHEQELRNDVSAPISLKESAICQDDSVHTASCPGQALPEDISAPKSPEEPAIHQDDSVPGSGGMCQTSRRRRIDEISTKLLSFKISSTVKPSHIAMNAPSTRQVDSLSQSAIALLRNRENTPAIKTDHPVKPNPDRSVAKNSSRRALQPISGRPGH
ncbi:hypothetical protein E2562_022451 [Oryza meyeriana var. granulata]|uniref:SAP domain-containing protein n=1 Tax=Oryza meyeriana var. granulata TaxID=110450 RepID=A0A6G1BMX7_9ORYZ|nr:hypothetical protein E2562_022451 [Oryza meyeriana var. granulata]